MIRIIGIPHHRNADKYVRELVGRDRPDVVGVERHEDVLGDLSKLLERGPRTDEEERTIRVEAGDGIVAAVESSKATGSVIVGLEPSRGYDISVSDRKPGYLGRLWKGFDRCWQENIYSKCHRKGELDPSIYQSSRVLPVVEGVQRWIWKNAWYRAYKTASVDREEAYAHRLIQLDQEKSVQLGRPARINFFVGAGHKWNTERLIRKLRRRDTTGR